MVSFSKLLSNLRHFILSEAESQQGKLEKQWSRPLAERVSGGWAIEGIRVVKFKDGLLTLRCDTNQSRFREGDLLVLHRANPRDPDALHIELQYDGETELEASLQNGNPFFFLSQPEDWIADQDTLDMTRFYLEAIDDVADRLVGQSIILPLLSGALTPKLDYARYERAYEAMSPVGLNESQVEAVAQAYATDLVHLIQGPPGTGKTVVLAHLVRLLIEDGQRVLVTAFTHRAINNALNKIASIDSTLPVCKIGDFTHADDLKVTNYANFDSSGFGDISKGYAIGATPFATRTKRLNNVEFDVVIFDEASQVTLPLAIMGMLAGQKYIFVGDKNQLPPVTTSDSMSVGKESVLGFLSDRGADTMLNITYRMNDILSDWPSRTFYRGELKPSEAASHRRLELGPGNTRWDFVLDPSAPAIFLDLCHRNTTIRSKTEADVVCELILALLERGISPDEIGVVVPYRAQSRLIRSLLRRNSSDPTLIKHLVVDTVERMQGQEREVVIVSLTTSSTAFAAQLAEFLFQPQRINVAATRPRTKLILVGSHRLLSVKTFDPDLDEYIQMFKDLIGQCNTITIEGGQLT